MNSTHKDKMNSFAISIRHESRQKKIRQLRNKFLQVIPQNYHLQDYIKCLDLLENPDFAFQNHFEDPYILVRILLAKQDNFIRISFKKSANPDMVDEKLIPSEKSQFELEEVQLPKQYPFTLQGSLIQSIAGEMQKNSQKYKKMPKQMQSNLIDFFIKYLKRNTYREVAQQYNYHQVLLNFMEYFVSYIDCPDLTKEIIKWVSGTEGLKLISYCLPGTFMQYTVYHRLYNLIVTGLKHKKMQVRYEAIHVLDKCIRNADFDEIMQILQQIPQVLKELIHFFEKMDQYQANQQFQTNPDLLQAARVGGLCIRAFLDCYDQEKIRCAEEGAGYVGAWLIMQKEQELIKIGLTIFNCISESLQNEKYPRGIQFLLDSASINLLEVWNRLGKSYQIMRHPNIEIRLDFVTFLLRAIANAQYSHVVQINSLFQFPNNENLVQILIQIFIENDHVPIRFYVLLCFQAILFYGDGIREEQINQDLNSKRKGEFNKKSQLTIQRNYVMDKITNSNMIKIMETIWMQERQLILNKKQQEKDLGMLIIEFFNYLHNQQKKDPLE